MTTILVFDKLITVPETERFCRRGITMPLQVFLLAHFMRHGLLKKRLIGQNVLVITAIFIEKPMGIAVISFFQQLRGWTKRVGKTPLKC